MLTIGLTGGIGSGKSTVAKYFSELGIEIIDTDELAREVVQPGTEALNKIIEKFGAGILDKEQHLDRKKLRNIIFKDVEARQWLEQLLHPLIRQCMRERIAHVKSPYCVAVIPLLVETKPNKSIHRVLVVDSPENLQISRVQQRDKLTSAQVNAILKAQASRDQRLSAADDVIHNDGNLNHLKQQVTQLHQRYLKLSQNA